MLSSSNVKPTSFKYRTSFAEIGTRTFGAISDLREAHKEKKEGSWYGHFMETFVTGLSDNRLAQIGLLKQVMRALAKSDLPEEEKIKIATGAWIYVDSDITKTEYNRIHSSIYPGSTFQQAGLEIIGCGKDNPLDNTSKYESSVSFQNFMKANNIFEKTLEMGRKLFVESELIKRTGGLVEETNKEEIKKSVEEESKKLSSEQLSAILPPVYAKFLKILTPEKMSKDLEDLKKVLNPPEWKIQRKPDDPKIQNIYSAFFSGVKRFNHGELAPTGTPKTIEEENKIKIKNPEAEKVANEGKRFYAIQHFDRNRLKHTQTRIKEEEVDNIVDHVARPTPRR